MRKSLDLHALGRAVAAAQDARAKPSHSDEQLRQRIATEAMVGTAPRQGWARRWPTFILVPALATAALAIGLAGLMRARTQSPVSFTIGDSAVPGRAGELVSVPSDSPQPVVLRFSDGTSVSLRPAARGRIAGMKATGAEVVVEAGRARFDVVHGPGTNWLVRTGPFSVQVIGTKFETEYEPGTDQFVLEVEEGSVVVSGCGLGPGRTVAAHQQLRASCSAPSSLTAPTTPAAGTTPPRPDTSPGALGDSRHLRVPAATAGSRSWSALAREGHYAEAYEIVRDDFDHQTRVRSAGDVWLLGDVARLTGHTQEARRAYAAIRRRFPATTTSADAAFALGRLSIGPGADRVASEQWFETYFRERPEGPLAHAALARIMELRVKRRDQVAAAATAAEYLRRFPRGPLASEARALTAGPVAQPK